MTSQIRHYFENHGQMVVQLAKFLVVGVLNTLVGLLVIYGAKWFLAFGDIPANALGYAIGLTVSFVLNKSWTFQHQGEVWKAAARFLCVFGVAYSVNLLCVLLLINVGAVDSYLAQAMGIPPYTLTFFLLSRCFAFRQKPLGGKQVPVNSSIMRTGEE